MKKWELDSLQLKRVQLADIGQNQTTSVTEIMDVILITEICEVIENNGGIIVDIRETTEWYKNLEITLNSPPEKAENHVT